MFHKFESKYDVFMHSLITGRTRTDREEYATRPKGIDPKGVSANGVSFKGDRRNSSFSNIFTHDVSTSEKGC